MKSPLFSIITVSYNAAEIIGETIQSVLGQTYDNYEIIVKDAMSDDGTLQQIPSDGKIRVYSTRDGGIYSGMNEAVGYATGEYILFLNCGDTLCDGDVLKDVAECINCSGDKNGIVYGNYVWNGALRKQPSKLDKFYMYRTPICHQTMFYPRAIFGEKGGYDESLKICADCKFNFEAFFGNVGFRYINRPISVYLGGGASEAGEGQSINDSEFNELRKKYFSVTERFLYNTILFFSLVKLRKWIVSERSPFWIRNLYSKVLAVVNK